jgi:hypothetical protein
MQTISFTTLLEESVANHSFSRASGNVMGFDRLLKAESFAALEQAHPGIFAFLAFHPGVDTAVANYVREGTLGSDSGPRILVLFTLDAEIRIADLQLTVDDVEIDAGVHPAYQMVRILFAPKAPPALPGIIFINQFTEGGGAVYSQLDNLPDASAVRERLRTLFAMAEKSMGTDGNRRKFISVFASSLQAGQLPYSTSSKTSLREWLIRSLQFVVKYRSDLVAVLSALP